MLTLTMRNVWFNLLCMNSDFLLLIVVVLICESLKLGVIESSINHSLIGIF